MTLSLIEAIHRRWTDSAALCALLPASRVTTGMSAEPGVPRAVIHKQSDRPLVACNDGSAVAQVGIRIRVFHDDYAAAAAVVDRLKAMMERAEFALTDGNRVIDVQRADDSQEQQEDGVWQMTVDFNCAVHLAACH